MRSLLRALGTSVVLVAAPLFVSCSAESHGTEAAVLKFTAIPDQNATELKQRFDTVAAHLTEELGIQVEFVPVADYTASVEAFTNGQVHLAWFGGLTGVRARLAVDGARAIAQGTIDPRYKSYFIANPDSGLEPGGSGPFPMELAGKSFTFGSDSSTSGRLMPEFFIREATKQSPEDFFGSPNRYSGSHDKTWEAVQNGSVDAGALSYTTYDKRLAEGAIDPARCFIVWQTPDYPDYSWNAHPAIDEIFGAGTIDRLQAVLVSIDDPELLSALDRPEGLTTARNEDFAPLVGLAEQLELLR
ncbi:Phosphate-import protein PhnD precursor [Planctomycetes bacterium Pla163]|uniref:Phosphate-import protein PhnD n=1 Tax=Rohdeia mirabilis TaxID=2528008 RepID=A0A518CYX8_9BACT|nr:Phosphate-import protein PhnD precursor [Planctomycetes bacterium Pla163]